MMKDAIYAGDLLLFTKTAVRNLAIAITETASPEVRSVLVKHLNQAVEQHAAVFNYMFRRGLYPAYNLQHLIQNDLNNAQVALSLPVKM